jgi:hypothetical protein
MMLARQFLALFGKQSTLVGWEGWFGQLGLQEQWKKKESEEKQSN